MQEENYREALNISFQEMKIEIKHKRSVNIFLHLIVSIFAF